MLREYYPAALVAFGDDLAGRDALAVLAAAPTPAQGRRLTRPGSTRLLPQGRAATQPRPPRGRQIVAALRTEQLPRPARGGRAPTRPACRRWSR